MTTSFHRAVTGAVVFALFVAAPAGAAERAIVTEAQQTLDTFKKTDPSLAQTLATASAYAVFPTITKGAMILGGAGGEGVLFENGVATGKLTMTQVTVGAQVGGQAYSELICFKDTAAVRDLKAGNLALAAQTSATAAASGAANHASYERGVQVFTLAKTGLMVEASVGGQKFTFTPFNKERVGRRVP